MFLTRPPFGRYTLVLYDLVDTSLTALQEQDAIVTQARFEGLATEDNGQLPVKKANAPNQHLANGRTSMVAMYPGSTIKIFPRTGGS